MTGQRGSPGRMDLGLDSEIGIELTEAVRSSRSLSRLAHPEVHPRRPGRAARRGAHGRIWTQSSPAPRRSRPTVRTGRPRRATPASGRGKIRVRFPELGRRWAPGSRRIPIDRRGADQRITHASDRCRYSLCLGFAFMSRFCLLFAMSRFCLSRAMPRPPSAARPARPAEGFWVARGWGSCRAA